MKHVNPIKHTTAENYEHFLSYMYGAGARHNALLCQAYFDGSDAPHEEYEAYMAAHPEPVKREPVAWILTDAEGNMNFDCQPTIKPNAEDYVHLRDGETFTPLYAAPVDMPQAEPTSVKQEPVAFMFKVKRATAASTVLDEFAALDYFPQDGEEIVSKEPLIYAAPVQPVKQEPVAWINEDELHEYYPYDEMFQSSRIIDGVRMFPNVKMSDRCMFYGLTKDHTWLSVTESQFNKLKPEARMKCYLAPVDAEAIRAEALEEAADAVRFADNGTEAAEIIRGMKRTTEAGRRSVGKTSCMRF